MNRMRCFVFAGGLAAAVLFVVPAHAVGGQTPETPPQQPAPAQPPEEEPTEIPTYTETVVVSASKTEQALVDAPASMTVIGVGQLDQLPAQSYGDLFRTVPGLNVSQTSARDINLTGRGATSTLSTTQLALLDGRSIYQDFFGFVAWDFLPVNFDEIKQIEVVRGPASVVWGANALSGVVNIITKSPRELLGSSFVLGAGGFSRDVDGSDEGAGSVFYVSGTHAEAVNDRWAFKVSGGAYAQDALARPTGTINNPFNTPYPPFENQGTLQPKFDGRVDYDFEDGQRKLIFAGGVAGTEGIIHTGIGPFDIDRGTVLGYGKTNFSRGPLKLNVFVNVLDGEATNLLGFDPTGRPLRFIFENRTFDVEFGNVQAVRGTHVLTYGGNVRYNSFDLSLAPRGDNRTEVGGYLQDEIFLSDQLRLVLGGRVDKFDVLDTAVFSPRVALLLKPAPSQTVRVSFNRAYRAPSLVNNFLEARLINQIDLGLITPLLRGRIFSFPILAEGNPDLSETSVNGFEVGYTGAVAERATVSAAWYFNRTRNDVFFTQVDAYSAANPPPGWPLPPIVLDLLRARGQGLPSRFTYLNFGRVDEYGIELGIDSPLAEGVNAFANYSWQSEPDADFDLSELNLPPRHRANAGIAVSHGRYQGTLSVSFTDEAFWQDVLDARFHGTTDAYTLVNAGFGVRWLDGRAVASVKVSNLANVDAQQHVFGDVIKRQVVGELKVRF